MEPTTTRDYSTGPAKHRTPIAYALNVPDKKLSIHTWVCSADDSMNKSKWFFEVEVRPADGSPSEYHYHMDHAHALAYRAQVAGEKPMVIQEVPMNEVEVMFGGRTERVILPLPADVQTWAGYTLDEIMRIRS